MIWWGALGIWLGTHIWSDVANLFNIEENCTRNVFLLQEKDNYSRASMCFMQSEISRKTKDFMDNTNVDNREFSSLKTMPRNNQPPVHVLNPATTPSLQSHRTNEYSHRSQSLIFQMFHKLTYRSNYSMYLTFYSRRLVSTKHNQTCCTAEVQTLYSSRVSRFSLGIYHDASTTCMPWRKFNKTPLIKSILEL